MNDVQAAAKPQPPSSARIGWVVDVQNDFMLPSGRLYVHHLSDPSDLGAVAVAPAIERTVRWMHTNCDALVFTGDWHGYGDREIDTVHPDPSLGTYPPHCMGLSPDDDERRGAALLASIAPGPQALVLERDATLAQADQLARAAIREHRPIFVRKSEFSVFEGNEAADALVRSLVDTLHQPCEFVVCGVATDVCVKAAVEGLLDRGYGVRVVPDATWGLGLLGTEETFRAWSRRGAILTPVDELTPNE